MPDLKAKLKFWKLTTKTNGVVDEKRKKYEEDWPRSAIEPQSSFHIESELDYQRAFESRFPPPTSPAHRSSSTRITKNDHDSAVAFARRLKEQEKGLRKLTPEEIGHRRNKSSESSEKGLRKLSEEQKRHRREKSEPSKARPPTDFQAILDDNNNGGFGHDGNAAAAGSGRHYNTQPGYGGDSANPNGAMAWAFLQDGHGHHGYGGDDGGNAYYGGDAGGYSHWGGYGGDGGGYGGGDAGGGGGDGGGGGC
ncbi:hypothetical protein B0J14DRAFT_657981 [Halenospora varia]|nr:hypothetical protein B0J14DRAFT_657981 [Halenospora varia]